MRKQLLGKFRAEKDKMPAEKKTLVLTHFPRFLSLLEEEVYAPNSPIWDPDFKQVCPFICQHKSNQKAIFAQQVFQNKMMCLLKPNLGHDFRRSQ